MAAPTDLAGLAGLAARSRHRRCHRRSRRGRPPLTDGIREIEEVVRRHGAVRGGRGRKILNEPHDIPAPGAVNRTVCSEHKS